MLDPDIDYLWNKMHFLTSRAEAHKLAFEADSTGHHQLCFAALLRDAGVIASYLGNVDAASEYLTRSGTAFADLGLFAGYSLLETCNPGYGYEFLRKNFQSDQPIRQLLSSERDEPKEDRSDQYRSNILKSLSSPQQLLNLYHVCRATEDSYEAEFLKERAYMYHRLPVGGLGFTLWDYFELVDMATSTDTSRKLGADTIDIYREMMFVRSRFLQRARKDEWHWKQMTNPARIVDMNLLAISTLILRKSDLASELTGIVGPFIEREPFIVLPMKLAQLFGQGGSAERY